ncbi:MAG: hypothetical protein A2015_12755 [Spirochaetes bacterium GWF1_31_7]|nr:MAG: hypothetical protein A2Y30_10545 [Spirochaetes bacterium GWE1_32_154]OHD49252.1 MAG: hypothetical protein A2Y29_16175 [Spirochaetes bacterium GWE2_31_10]OHD51814.1 MAG: hypothetical protein A2015_12755 [Spirochaetes bacterium GWF1_31_7]OHD78493.1 MAG: hypothetical protein A2355_05715 [Spirochaetes bacterium RIFOXYB1_FULL_32_8]
MPGSIRVKIYIYLIIVTIIPIFFMGLIFTSFYRQKLEHQLLDVQKNTLMTLKKDIIDRHIQDMKKLLIALADEKDLYRVFDDVTVKQRITEKWEFSRKIFPEREWIYYGNNHNQLFVIPEWKPPVGYEVSTRPWYKTGKESGTIQWTYPYNEYISGDLVLSATIGIKNANNQYTGVLSLDTTAFEFLKLLQTHSLFDSEKIIILSDAGDAVSISGKDSTLTNQTKNFDWKNILNNDNTKDIITIQTTDYYYSIISLPEINLFVVSLLPAHVLNEKTNHVFLLLYLTLLIGLFIATGFGFVLSKYLITNVLKLNNYINQAVNHNFPVKNVVRGNDEFHTINTNLNFLLQTIKNQIDELKQMNIMLEESLENKEKLIALRTSLLHIYSHNGNSPITYLYNTSKDLLYTENTADNRMLFTASKELKSLNENLMTYLKLEDGIKGSYKDIVCLSEITEMMVNNYEMMCEFKDITLMYNSLEISDVVSSYFFIKILLENLIDNAVKYSYPGSSIKINIYTENDTIIWEIIDGGPGFTLKDKTMLYKKFQTLSAKPTNGESSTGLGMYLVKQLSDYLKVDLSLVNNPDETGAYFRLAFNQNKF